MADAPEADFEARYQAWLAEREREGCACLTCMMTRRKSMDRQANKEGPSDGR